ncbi:hypothetical protein [Streptomyces sp. SJL17-1]|uniref:hypothetical protein n=1 Tax=Streptomyces sp. SJL17-1 TaxID=2967223 RepID=UPI0029672868|nr:hypothetical protein [Streptomyces sp. SJL17-1]
MDTMSVSVAAARSTASVADARESARDFLDRVLPPIAAEARRRIRWLLVRRGVCVRRKYRQVHLQHRGQGG